MLRASVPRELFEDLPRRDEVAVVERGQRPVDEKQVDVVRIERLQRLVEGAARVIGLVKAVVELAGDEDLAALKAGVADALADFLFISVHFGGVDVPVSDVERRLDRRGRLVGLDLEHPETELWDLDTVVEFDRGNLAHGISPFMVYRRRRERR